MMFSSGTGTGMTGCVSATLTFSSIGFVSMETGKLVFIVFSLIMLCNGIDFWTKIDAYNQKARAENREEK